MPFDSQAQARAAFGGYLGPEMKSKADEFAHATPGGIKSLPQHVRPGGHHPHLKKRISVKAPTAKTPGPPDFDHEDAVLRSIMHGLNQPKV
jgi:hypothetical protein